MPKASTPNKSSFAFIRFTYYFSLLLQRVRAEQSFDVFPEGHVSAGGIAQPQTRRRKALLRGRAGGRYCAHRRSRWRVVANTDASTRHLPCTGIEVESDVHQHCFSGQRTAIDIVVRHRDDDRVGRLERPQLTSVIVSSGIDNLTLQATARSLHAGKIEVQQDHRSGHGIVDVNYHAAGNIYVAVECGSTVRISHRALDRDQDATVGRTGRLSSRGTSRRGIRRGCAVRSSGLRLDG